MQKGCAGETFNQLRTRQHEHSLPVLSCDAQRVQSTVLGLEDARNDVTSTLRPSRQHALIHDGKESGELDGPDPNQCAGRKGRR